MLTKLTEQDWELVLEIFRAARPRRGEPGHNDRRFLEALIFFTVNSLSWRAIPAEFGKGNSIWKRFWRLSRAGTFEVFFQLLAEQSPTAHLVQFFDSTVTRDHVPRRGVRATAPSRSPAAWPGDIRLPLRAG